MNISQQPFLFFVAHIHVSLQDQPLSNAPRRIKES